MQKNQFKQWLSANGVKQSEIAALIGKSLSTTNAKINGTTAWLPQDLDSLKAAYGLSADFVLGLSPQPYARTVKEEKCPVPRSSGDGAQT